MIIYRPHRGRLAEAIAESKEFETEEEMKYYIMRQYRDFADGMLKMEHSYIDVNPRDVPRYIDNPLFDLEDIVIGNDVSDDERCGWHDTRDVCIKRFGNENYMEQYGCPQCIGFCATDYERSEAVV